MHRCPSCFETPRHNACKTRVNALKARLLSMRARKARSCAPLPHIPAQAGIQSQGLGPRFRGDERMLHTRARADADAARNRDGPTRSPSPAPKGAPAAEGGDVARALRRGSVIRPPSAPRQLRAALILLAWVLSCGGVLLRQSIPSYVRAPVPPQSRSWPFPAILGGAVPIWSRRPTANTLARTREILREMSPWRAPRG